MYGSVLTLEKSISSSVLKAPRISAVSLFMVSGLVRRRYVTPDSSVAVVSEPPMTRRPLLAWSFSRVRPCMSNV
jgi:hypothetical protein